MPTEEEMDEEREKRRKERRERAAADSAGKAQPDTTTSTSSWRKLIPEYGGAVRANRVEEAYAGASAQYRLGERTRVHGDVGYSTGVERIAGWRTAHGKLNLGLRVGYERGVARRYDSDVYHHFFNSAQALIGLDDYFDYGWRGMGEVELSATG